MVLDRSLPDGDGAVLASRLRAAGYSLAILMLTARDTLDDKLAGFGAGADDYLAKPFALKEVEAQLQTPLRPSGGQPATQRLAFGALSYDPADQAVTLADRPRAPPPKALRLVAVLLRQPQRFFSRRELEMAIWAREQEASDNLRGLLHAVRRALTDTAPVKIINVHGLGYKLVSRSTRAEHAPAHRTGAGCAVAAGHPGAITDDAGGLRQDRRRLHRPYPHPAGRPQHGCLEDCAEIGISRQPSHAAPPVRSRNPAS